MGLKERINAKLAETMCSKMGLNFKIETLDVKNTARIDLIESTLADMEKWTPSDGVPKLAAQVDCALMLGGALHGDDDTDEVICEMIHETLESLTTENPEFCAYVKEKLSNDSTFYGPVYCICDTNQRYMAGALYSDMDCIDYGVLIMVKRELEEEFL